MQDDDKLAKLREYGERMKDAKDTRPAKVRTREALERADAAFGRAEDHNEGGSWRAAMFELMTAQAESNLAIAEALERLPIGGP